ncbi:MAG: ABC transporter ATP-binding protein [Bryobacterales bacterium]|nr:ABC transporter ATP-binding protein [Bryobacterales bacterium]
MEEEVLGKAYDGRLMRRLLTYVRPYKLPVVVAFALLLVNAAVQVIGPLLTALAVDRYLAPSGKVSHTILDPYLAANPWTGLAQISFLYLLVVIVGMFCDFGEQYIMQWVGQKTMFDLRRQMMAHLQRLDVSFYDQNPVGRLVTRITTDVDALNELFASGLLMILGDLLMLSFVIVVMLKLSPGMTAFLLAVMPLVVLITMQFRRAVQKSYRRIRVAIARINSYLQEHISGIAVLQLFNREAHSRAEFDAINRDHMEAYKGAIIAYGWFYPIAEFLGMLALALLLAYGGFRVRGGAIQIGVLVAFFQYGLRFFRPIQDLSEKYNIMQSAMAAAERVFKLLDTPVEIQSPPNSVPLPRSPAAVEFEHVWFTYNAHRPPSAAPNENGTSAELAATEASPLCADVYKADDWVLRDVSFRIEPGETIAVVGHTGAGKTTLASLLLRFYEVQRGVIRIGGIDIRNFDLEDLRRNFGVVLQDPHLFTGTIAENIRLGTPGISDEQLSEAAARVNLLDFVQTLPERFAQSVRERGAGYSTGQKQLINFARALAHNPRFLILDEATSSVDTETELRIREALRHLVEGRTSIVIAHRLSTIQRADRILVMHKGKLREIGTHQELLALRDIYWKLYQLQYQDQDMGTALLNAEPVAGD